MKRDVAGQEWDVIDYRTDRGKKKRVALGDEQAVGRAFVPIGREGPVMIYPLRLRLDRATDEATLASQLTNAKPSTASALERMQSTNVPATTETPRRDSSEYAQVHCVLPSEVARALDLNSCTRYRGAPPDGDRRLYGLEGHHKAGGFVLSCRVALVPILLREIAIIADTSRERILREKCDLAIDRLSRTLVQ